MKNIKTYEAFFQDDHYYENPEYLYKRIGVTSEMIEDLLVDIEDKLPDIHISIEFTDAQTDFDLEKEEEVYGEIDLSIGFYPSGNLLKRISKSKEELNVKKLTWYDYILNGIDIEGEIEALTKRLELMGFERIEIHKNESRASSPSYSHIDNIDSLPKNNNQIGAVFLTIEATKKVIDKG